MEPPGQVHETRQLFQMIVNVAEDRSELRVAIRAREAHPLHAEINRHGRMPPMGTKAQHVLVPLTCLYGNCHFSLLLIKISASLKR